MSLIEIILKNDVFEIILDWSAVILHCLLCIVDNFQIIGHLNFPYLEFSLWLLHPMILLSQIQYISPYKSPFGYMYI